MVIVPNLGFNKPPKSPKTSNNPTPSDQPTDTTELSGRERRRLFVGTYKKKF